MDAIALPAVATKKIVEKLARANGNRRTRILDLSDVIAAVVEACKAPGKLVVRNAGTVANAYKYRAETTTVAVVCVPGNGIFVDLGVGDAKSGSAGSAIGALSGISPRHRPETVAAQVFEWLATRSVKVGSVRRVAAAA